MFIHIHIFISFHSYHNSFCTTQTVCSYISFLIHIFVSFQSYQNFFSTTQTVCSYVSFHIQILIKFIHIFFTPHELCVIVQYSSISFNSHVSCMVNTILIIIACCHLDSKGKFLCHAHKLFHFNISNITILILEHLSHILDQSHKRYDRVKIAHCSVITLLFRT